MSICSVTRWGRASLSEGAQKRPLNWTHSCGDQPTCLTSYRLPRLGSQKWLLALSYKLSCIYFHQDSQQTPVATSVTLFPSCLRILPHLYTFLSQHRPLSSLWACRIDDFFFFKLNSVLQPFLCAVAWETPWHSLRASAVWSTPWLFYPFAGGFLAPHLPTLAPGLREVSPRDSGKRLSPGHAFSQSFRCFTIFLWVGYIPDLAKSHLMAAY